MPFARTKTETPPELTSHKLPLVVDDICVGKYQSRFWVFHEHLLRTSETSRIPDVVLIGEGDQIPRAQRYGMLKVFRRAESSRVLDNPDREWCSSRELRQDFHCLVHRAIVAYYDFIWCSDLFQNAGKLSGQEFLAVIGAKSDGDAELFRIGHVSTTFKIHFIACEVAYCPRE